MDQQKVLRSPFDMDVHMRTFINYLEVIMLPEGTIEYAVPSHSEKLIAIARKLKNCNRSELYDMCPEEYYFDVNTWLCNETGCLAIWTDRVLGTPNEVQLEKLESLKEAGLLKVNKFQ